MNNEEKQEAIEPNIYHAFLHIHNACPLNCKHCYLHAKPRQNELTFQEWVQIFQKLHDAGVTKLLIEGGEPVTYPYAPELVSLAAEHFKHVAVQTSGAVVNQVLIKTLQEQELFDVTFAVSMEDIDQEFNDNIRGVGMQRKARLALAEYQNEGFNTAVRQTIYQNNHPLKTAKWATKEGHGYTGVPLIPVGYGKQMEKKEENEKQRGFLGKPLPGIPTAKRLKELFQNFHAAKENLNDALLDCPQYYLYDEDWLDKAKETFRQDNMVCAAAKRRIAITNTGEVYPCPISCGMEDDTFNLGNILRDEWGTIEQNAKEFLKQWIELEPSEQCSQCNYEPLCGGGCKITSFQNNQRGPHPCPLQK